MIRRHYFLLAAVAAILLMLAVVGVKLATKKSTGGPGGGPVAAAGAPGGAGAGAAPGAGGGAPGGGAAGGAAGAAGAQRRSAFGAQLVDVTTVPVRLQDFADRIEVLGVAKGRQSVSITSKNAELITAVRFHDGDHVRQGQVLVDLQGTEQDAAVDQAQSVVDLAKLNADRWTTLEQKGIAAKSNADQYRAIYEQAKASLAAAKSRRLDRVIRAPFAGVVGLSDVAPGALISPGAVIATLDDVSVIRVDFDIPDRYLTILKDGTPIVATADSYPNEYFSGTISKLDTRINERTRTIKARALLNNANGKLKPGMLMRIGIEAGRRKALVAPEAAVQFDDTQSYVFVVTRRPPTAAGAAGVQGAGGQPGAGGQGAGFGAQGQGQGQGGGQGAAAGAAGGPNAARAANVALSTKRTVVVGSRDKGFIEIKSGVKEGDILVADGINRLQPTMPVRIVAREGGGPGGPGGAGPGGQGGRRGDGAAAGGDQGGAPGAGGGRQRPDGAAGGDRPRPDGAQGGGRQRPDGAPGGGAPGGQGAGGRPQGAGGYQGGGQRPPGARPGGDARPS